MKDNNKGDHKTGIVWSYRRESEQMFHGDYDSRHEAIGFAAIIGRIMDEETHVRWHESMWTERDSPVVCGYCGFEDWYLPQVRWVYPTDTDDSPFCSTECYARYRREE